MQADLHSWFSSTTPSDSTSAGDREPGMNSDSSLWLLCWGFWKKTTEYSDKLYRVSDLQNDAKPRGFWVTEPSTIANFSYNNEQHVVTSCFRHVACIRLSITGEPFLDFMCSNCSQIVHATDFRLRVLCEARALVKRGFRPT